MDKHVEMLDAWTNYLLAEDWTTAGEEWNSYEAAQDDLDEMADEVDSAFDAYRTGLLVAGQRLKEVLTMDSLFPSEVAYVSGDAHYELTAQPFIFWRDLDFPNRDGLLDFTFVQLSAGSSQQFTSYTTLEIEALLQAAIDLEAWWHFYQWLNRNRNEATDCNDERAHDYDALCEWCEATPAARLYWEQYLFGRGFSLENLEAWCELDLCGETNTTRKAWSVRDAFPEFEFIDLDVVRDVVRDWIEEQYGPMYLITVTPES